MKHGKTARARQLLFLTLVTLALGELTSFGALRLLAAFSLGRAGSPALPLYAREPWAERHWQEIREVTAGVDYRSFVQTRRAPFRGETITIDAAGLRTTHYSRCDGDPPVLMFGGSTLWGWGAPDALTIPSLVARRFEEAGRPVCVVNEAELSRVSTQEVVDLLLALKTRNRPPAAVAFYDGCNDVLASLFHGQADVESMHGLFAGLLSSYSESQAGGFGFLERSNTRRLAEKIARRAGLRPPPAEAPVPAAVLAAQVAASYRANLELVRALARGGGFRAAFFLQPVALVGRKALAPAEEECVRASLPRPPHYLAALFQETYARVQDGAGQDFHDLSIVFDDRPEPLYYDVCHLTPAGNQIVADRMFEALRPLLP